MHGCHRRSFTCDRILAQYPRVWHTRDPTKRKVPENLNLGAPGQLEPSDQVFLIPRRWLCGNDRKSKDLDALATKVSIRSTRYNRLDREPGEPSRPCPANSNQHPDRKNRAEQSPVSWRLRELVSMRVIGLWWLKYHAESNLESKKLRQGKGAWLAGTALEDSATFLETSELLSRACD
ncbi:hypothetical protein BDV95DRAFT_155704 [Massariosphaeria phaeospora]|uniref:Uncharacterized protein n=1 Tax=Massariosphaeria phaeospora TaxID=100035 RepID=A0A7C8IEL2_9PLEO|nr:hypothetical protein BDV95DRAFT_155704 [Massariosphaeria phaeospora]